MSMDDFRITLDDFEGPLDLLLYLIRRDELEITDIPIARLAHQYIEALTLGGVEHIDIEQAGEFLVMASTLMEIKSRMLMPKPAADPAAAPAHALATPASDPRAELVRQLLAYKAYRDAAASLERRLGEWSGRFPSGGALAGAAPAEADADDAPVLLEDVTLADLARAFAAIIETVDLAKSGDHRVFDDETPVEIHAADIVDQLQRDARPLADGTAGLRFAEVFAGRTKAEAVGLFLAMLELMKQQRVAARQDRIHGEIFLQLLPESAVVAIQAQSMVD